MPTRAKKQTARSANPGPYAPQLSELESAVLGVFWRRGPCSAYVVQQNFSIISAGWSASPGSVYPLVHKLQRLKLISSAERERRGARTIQRFVLTPAGLKALQAWVTCFPEWSGLASADPIRTRSFFLDTINADARGAFIADAETRTKAALARLQEGNETQDPRSSERLAQLGGIYQLQARLRWLRILREELSAE